MTEAERLLAIAFHQAQIKKLRAMKRNPEACPKGHAYTPENTRWGGPNNTWRRCRSCHRERRRVRDLGWDTGEVKYA